MALTLIKVLAHNLFHKICAERVVHKRWQQRVKLYSKRYRLAGLTGLAPFGQVSLRVCLKFEHEMLS